MADNASPLSAVVVGCSMHEAAEGSLLIRKVEPQDAGKYLCLVTNAVGEERATITLDVRCFCPCCIQDERLQLSRHNTVPPLIERFAFDENLHEGMRTKVYCNIARGDPPVHITWLRNGQPIQSDPDIEVRVLDPF
ncbi:hypothetical protein MTO96_019559 [Rhipicephalus appendiculatus]